MPTPGAIKAGQAYIEIGHDDRALQQGLRGSETRFRRWGKRMVSIGKTTFVAVAAAAAALGTLTQRSIAASDKIAKIARRAGISAEAMSGLAYAAEIAGTSLEGIEKGFRRLQRNIYDASRGLSTALDAFEDLGLQWDELSKFSPEEQFYRVITAMRQLESHTMKAAIAQSLFGRAGSELLPLIDSTSDALEKQVRIGTALRGMWNKDFVAAEKANDAWTTLKTTLAGLRNTIAVELMSAMIKVGDELERWAESGLNLTDRLATAFDVMGMIAEDFGAKIKETAQDMELNLVRPFVKAEEAFWRFIAKTSPERGAGPAIRGFAEARAEDIASRWATAQEEQNQRHREAWDRMWKRHMGVFGNFLNRLFDLDRAAGRGPAAGAQGGPNVFGWIMQGAAARAKFGTMVWTAIETASRRVAGKRWQSIFEWVGGAFQRATPLATGTLFGKQAGLGAGGITAYPRVPKAADPQRQQVDEQRLTNKKMDTLIQTVKNSGGLG